VFQSVLPLHECADPAATESVTEPFHSVADSTAEPIQSVTDSVATESDVEPLQSVADSVTDFAAVGAALTETS
jgi:hypothetical protein